MNQHHKELLAYAIKMRQRSEGFRAIRMDYGLPCRSNGGGYRFFDGDD